MTSTPQYPEKGVVHVRRKKPDRSPVWLMVRYFLIWFMVPFGGSWLFLGLLSDKNTLIGPLIIISVLMSLYITLLDKGSLVREVTFNYTHQLIRIDCHHWYMKPRVVEIPFDRMRWTFVNGVSFTPRIYFYQEGRREAVITGTMLWTSSDLVKIKLRLDAIVPDLKFLR